ncbi:O-antigen ligase family protein [Sphingobium sp. DEHP117]|uniref:O-antigen ligase family protein n=1 Tax=Sphingobium sp. DEHP117 TaxID=2993436 RepID=UPI0027D55EFD|nr:O-antigen ligase family protein [Sphingobium sp. DEHP117]MDQ4420931.1 O-antigen ligase family protein [Sphingobium sp. DEHP117]
MKDIIGAEPVFFKILMGLVIAQTISVIDSNDVSSAFSAYMRIQLACTGALFMAIYVLSKPGRVLFFANMIRIVAVILAIIAVLEYENQGILWAHHIPSFLQVDDPAMTNLLDSAFRAGDYRVVGTFSVPLCYAEFMALTLPFFLHYMLFGEKRGYKIILLICDALVINAIFLTQARVGIVGIMVTHGIYGFIWSIRFWRTHKDSLFGPALALSYPVGLTVFALAMIFIGRLRGLWMGGATEGASTLGRFAQAEAFPPVFIQKPLFGYGPAQGAKALNFRNPAGELSIDSGLLNIPLCYGAVGAVFYFGMFIFMLIMGMKLAFNARDREIAYAMPAAVAVSFWLVSRIVLAQEDNASFMYMMLAMLVALSYQQKKMAATDTGSERILMPSAAPLPA